MGDGRGNEPGHQSDAEITLPNRLTEQLIQRSQQLIEYTQLKAEDRWDAAHDSQIPDIVY
ncbi:hypothetical protein H4R33_000420 [Dimargaris cristalligena]|nr:hypothetical protein H4R33_000420 [Dimargaris cristalligena]